MDEQVVTSTDVPLSDVRDMRELVHHAGAARDQVIIEIAAAVVVSGGSSLELRPETFFDDLRRNQPLTVGDPRTVVVGGFPALAAEVRGQFDGGAYPNLAMRNTDVALAFSGEAPRGGRRGANFVVHIWASSEEELAAWLPMATLIAASIRFTGE